MYIKCVSKRISASLIINQPCGKVRHHSAGHPGDPPGWVELLLEPGALHQPGGWDTVHLGGGHQYLLLLGPAR